MRGRGTEFFVILCACLLTFCVRKSEAQEVTKFRVGVIIPFTGALAEYGVAAKNGIELARMERPQLFSNIEFFYDDSQYDAAKTLSAFRHFQQRGDVSLSYVWGYSPSQAVIPVAEAERIPALVVSGEKQILKGAKSVLRFCYRIDEAADVLVGYLRSKNFKHLAVVKTEIAYMDGMLEWMRAGLRPDESINVIERFPFGASDFKATLTKLKAQKFDVLGVFLVGGAATQFYRELKQRRIVAPTITTDFLDSMTEVQAAHGAMTGAVFAGPYSEKRFVERYVKAYGNDAQVAWAANAFEFAILVGKLFNTTPGKIAPTEVLDRLRSVGDTVGEATSYRFDPSPDGPGFVLRVVARQIEADRIVDYSGDAK